MRYIQIYKADLLNGEGLRNVYFFSGCEKHCKGCFSPETWDPMTPISKEWGEEEFQQMIEDSKKPYISGITLLGGDPFYPTNRDGILDLCKRYKEYFGDTRTIWLYTGYTLDEIEKSGDQRLECLKYIDVLCEGPFIKELASPEKPWVGSSNQRVIKLR